MRRLFLKLMGKYYQLTGHYPRFLETFMRADIGPETGDELRDGISIGMWELEYGFHTPLAGAWISRQIKRIRGWL